MSTASDLELQMLNLINADRAEAGLDSLRIDATLNDAAEDHSDWMLDTGTFSHQGAGDSSSTDRIRAAGYDLEGRWATGENIAWQSERGAAGLSDDVADLHRSLMDSPGHRANILSPTFDEIGIGIERGDFTTAGDDWDAVMVTQSFGLTSASDAPDAETEAVADTAASKDEPNLVSPNAAANDDSFAFMATGADAAQAPQDLFARIEDRLADWPAEERTDARPDLWAGAEHIADLFDFV